MKFLLFPVLAIFSACSELPLIEKEAEEIIEYEVAEHICLWWWEEESEEAENLKKDLREIYKDEPYPYIVKIRPKKWPWGMC